MRISQKKPGKLAGYNADGKLVAAVLAGHVLQVQRGLQKRRRNLTDEQKTYLIGKQYEAQKNTVGNHAVRGEDGKYLSAQNEHLGGNHHKTKDIIAREHGIGSTSVQRAEQFSKGLDAAESASPGIKEAILSGEVKAPKSVIARIRDIPEDQRPGGCNQSNAYDRNETDKNR